jgi:hypothetical protein
VILAGQPPARHVFGPLYDAWLADRFAGPELLAREIDLKAAREPVPVVHPGRRTVSVLDIGEQ